MESRAELSHYGVLGMKWGVRRYQNADGTLTSEGKARKKQNEKLQRKADKMNAKAAKANAKMLKTIRNGDRRITGYNIGVNGDIEFTYGSSKATLDKATRYMAREAQYIKRGRDYVNRIQKNLLEIGEITQAEYDKSIKWQAKGQKYTKQLLRGPLD